MQNDQTNQKNVYNVAILINVTYIITCLISLEGTLTKEYYDATLPSLPPFGGQ